MDVQIHLEKSLDHRETLTAHIQESVAGALQHSSNRISRVEVHLNDENGDKAGAADKRCMMEARVEGRQPTAVTHHAASFTDAIDGAAGKLSRVLDTMLAKMNSDR